MFNPWTGTRRLAGDVGTDVFGLLVLPPGEPLYASSAPLEGLPRARPLSDDLMDCVDRLGSEFGSVDPRVWDHLLVYAPNEKVAQRAAAIQLAADPRAPELRKPPNVRANLRAEGPSS